MTPEDQDKLDATFKVLLMNETRFLESDGQGKKNAAGSYCYVSQDNNHYIALDFYLMYYKKWLIENKIVKEI